MPQAARKLDPRVVELEQQQRPPSREAVQAAPADMDDGLLATAGPLMAASYAVAMVIVAGTFWQHGEAMFVIVVSAGFAAMFFTLPYLMLRIRRRRDGRWRSDAMHVSRDVAIYTGTIHRSEAIVQMVIVPMAVVGAFAAFATIWLLVGP